MTSVKGSCIGQKTKERKRRGNENEIRKTTTEERKELSPGVPCSIVSRCRFPVLLHFSFSFYPSLFHIANCLLLGQDPVEPENDACIREPLEEGSPPSDGIGKRILLFHFTNLVHGSRALHRAAVSTEHLQVAPPGHAVTFQYSLILGSTENLPTSFFNFQTCTHAPVGQRFAPSFEHQSRRSRKSAVLTWTVVHRPICFLFCFLGGFGLPSSFWHSLFAGRFLVKNFCPWHRNGQPHREREKGEYRRSYMFLVTFLNFIGVNCCTVSIFWSLRGRILNTQNILFAWKKELNSITPTFFFFVFFFIVGPGLAWIFRWKRTNLEQVPRSNTPKATRTEEIRNVVSTRKPSFRDD